MASVLGGRNTKKRDAKSTPYLRHWYAYTRNAEEASQMGRNL